MGCVRPGDCLDRAWMAPTGPTRLPLTGVQSFARGQPAGVGQTCNTTYEAGGWKWNRPLGNQSQ